MLRLCGGIGHRRGRQALVRLIGAAGAASGGLHVPGVYRALLEKERESASKSRIVWIDPDDHSQGCFARGTHLLEALEAGEVVGVPVWFWVGIRCRAMRRFGSTSGGCRRLLVTGSWRRTT